MSCGAKPIYGYRPVLNAEEIVDWARKSGFRSTLMPDDMHVTTLYSRRAFSVELSSMIEKRDIYGSMVCTGGKRTVMPLGDKGAVVLKMEDADLQEEWKLYRDLGASWDFPEYQPHVTLTYKGAPKDIGMVAPYEGPIILGWTKYRDLNLDASSDVPEMAITDA